MLTSAFFRSFPLVLIGTLLLPGCAENSNVSRQGTPDSGESGSNATPSAVKSGDRDTLDNMETLSLDEPADPSRDSGSLGIGDPAPMISISKWIQGEPVTGYGADRIHVVEFWATWCGPCIAGMPHLSALQDEYGDKVAFIGVTAEDEETVTRFLKRKSGHGEQTWSETITYRIALDADRTTNREFMEAAGQNGIPCAFIVGRSGLVEWIGHPMEIDTPLKQVVDGTWDWKAAKDAARQAEAVAVELHKIRGPLQELIEAGDYPAAVKLMDGLLTRFPDNSELQLIRFQWLILGGMSEEVNQTAKSLIERFHDNSGQLDQIAWMMTSGSETSGIDLSFAKSAIERAIDLTNSSDASTHETHGRVLFQMGRLAEAVESQKKAIEHVTDSRMADNLQMQLKVYEAALSPPAGPEDSGETAPVSEENDKQSDSNAEPDAGNSDADNSDTDNSDADNSVSE